MAVKSNVASNLEAIEDRIAQACKRAGRKRESVRLVGVTKGQPLEAIQEAYALGLRSFGENYAQELLTKAAALATGYDDLEWRFIGHLQRNKIRTLIGVVHAVETVDALELAGSIAKRAVLRGGPTDILIQVNIGREPQKGGCLPEELSALAQAIAKLEGSPVRGLMAIPPLSDDPGGARPYFSALRELAESLALGELSMGMSHDFEVAIEEGATLIRVGTALFGPRTPRV